MFLLVCFFIKASLYFKFLLFDNYNIKMILIRLIDTFQQKINFICKFLHFKVLDTTLNCFESFNHFRRDWLSEIIFPLHHLTFYWWFLSHLVRFCRQNLLVFPHSAQIFQSCTTESTCTCRCDWRQTRTSSGEITSKTHYLI